MVITIAIISATATNIITARYHPECVDVFVWSITGTGDAIGFVVGVGIGVAVTLGVGAIVGLTVGSSVGMTVAVGSVVGFSVSSGLGDAIGSIVGAAVGSSVDSIVCSTVDIAVGSGSVTATDELGFNFSCAYVRACCSTSTEKPPASASSKIKYKISVSLVVSYASMSDNRSPSAAPSLMLICALALRGIVKIKITIKIPNLDMIVFNICHTTLLFRLMRFLQFYGCNLCDMP